MNTAAAARRPATRRTQNIGFAIPIANIRALLPGLRKGGTIGRPKAFLGVEVVSVTPPSDPLVLTATSGAVVVSVFPGSPAALAGIRAGDVIVGFGGQPITSDFGLTRGRTSGPPRRTGDGRALPRARRSARSRLCWAPSRPREPG